MLLMLKDERSNTCKLFDLLIEKFHYEFCFILFLFDIKMQYFDDCITGLSVAFKFLKKMLFAL